MALSEAQTFGFSDNVQELFEKARRDLEAGGLDVDGILADLRKAHAAAVQANAVQEDRKRAAKESTKAADANQLALYHATSSALDMAIGAVGKTTISAANFRKLRSDIQREVATGPETPGEVPVESTR